MSISVAQLKQLQLKYKNRIIQIEKELDFEKLRADEYEKKYADLMINGETNDGQIIEQLSFKEQEVNQLRKENFQLTKKLSTSSPEKGDLKAEQYLRQNQQLRQIMEELKGAAIAAIMEKDSEIEQLKNQLQDFNVVSKLQAAQQKIITLEEELKIVSEQSSKQIEQLNQKIILERQTFSDKLIQLHKQVNYEETEKHELLQKTHHLEGDLESMEKIVQNYDKKISQLQSSLSLQKVNNAQNEHNLEIKLEQLEDQKKTRQKNQKQFIKTIENVQRTVDEKEKQIEQLKQENEELDRKLKIRKRKQKGKAQTNSVFSSFEEFSKKADLYSSFAKKQNATMESFAVSTSNKLSQITQIQQIQNFSYTDFKDVEEEVPKQNIIENETMKKSHSVSQENVHTIDQQKVRLLNTNKDLEEKIKSYLAQIQKLNGIIQNKTKQLKKEREKANTEVKAIKKAESQLIVERESLKLHIYKLENALLVQKLQNAERLETHKDILEYERKVHEDQIENYKKQQESPKKKKGFFS